MTTIAYRDGIMASDSGSWAGEAAHGWARKLARGTDGTLYGVAGNAAQCEGYLQWVDDGCAGDAPKPDKEGPDGHDSSFIVLKASPKGMIELVTVKGVERYMNVPYYAIGAGAATAFGALFVGASAEVAIEAAKEHGAGAFGRVQVVQHHGKPQIKAVTA